MPREDLRSRILNQRSDRGFRKSLYEKYGVLGNPFPSAGQTSGHPRNPTEDDRRIDDEIVQFYQDGERKSRVIAVTASQGIGKTNLLNDYERWLKENLEEEGFFVIRYIPDPEPSFDPLIRSIFDDLGDNHLKKLARALVATRNLERLLDAVRTGDMKRMLQSILNAAEDDQDELDEVTKLAQEWLLGLRVYKAHRERLGVNYRLDTVESKTRALRDLVFCSYSTGTLEGVFLLLDELEKHDFSLSKTMVVRYLNAIRALIDALPRNLFLMMAITTDALGRYSEMLPALRGRLANVVQLRPLQTPKDAIGLYLFYERKARESAEKGGDENDWTAGSSHILQDEVVRALFRELAGESTIEGVRQRDFLNELNRRTQEIINES